MQYMEASFETRESTSNDENAIFDLRANAKRERALLKQLLLVCFRVHDLIRADCPPADVQLVTRYLFHFVVPHAVKPSLYQPSRCKIVAK